MHVHDRVVVIYAHIYFITKARAPTSVFQRREYTSSSLHIICSGRTRTAGEIRFGFKTDALVSGNNRDGREEIFVVQRRCDRFSYFIEFSC